MSKDVSFCKLRKNKILSDNFNKWTKENNYNILQIEPNQRTFEDYLVTNVSATQFNFSMNSTEVDKNYTVKMYATDKNVEIPAGEYYIYFYSYRNDVDPYFTTAAEELSISLTEPYDAEINIIFENRHINISQQVENHVTFDSTTHFNNFEFMNTNTNSVYGTFRGFFMMSNKKLNLGIGDADNHPNLFNPYVGEIPEISVETGHCEMELPPYGLLFYPQEIQDIFPSGYLPNPSVNNPQPLKGKLIFNVDFYNLSAANGDITRNISTSEYDIASGQSPYNTDLEDYTVTTATYEINGIYDLQIETVDFLRLLIDKEDLIQSLRLNNINLGTLDPKNTGYIVTNNYEGTDVIGYPTFGALGKLNHFNENKPKYVYLIKSLMNYYFTSCYTSNTEPEFGDTMYSPFYTLLTRIQYDHNCLCFALCYVNPVPVYGDKNEA